METATTPAPAPQPVGLPVHLLLPPSQGPTAAPLCRQFLWVAALQEQTTPDWTVPADGTVVETFTVPGTAPAPLPQVAAAAAAAPVVNAANRIWPPPPHMEMETDQAASALNATLGYGGPRVSSARGAYIPSSSSAVVAAAAGGGLRAVGASFASASVLASSDFHGRLQARLFAINAELQRVEYAAKDLEIEFGRVGGVAA
jgi:hypothetical protein